MFKGLRTIPVIFDIVKDVQEICPDAWIINFTNPAGMVTEAVYRHTNFKRFIGVCNIPIGMKMFITDVLQLSPSDELNIDLFGLNHRCSSATCWLTASRASMNCWTAWPPAV